MDDLQKSLLKKLVGVEEKDFPKFYDSLTKLEKAEYKVILERILRKFGLK